MCIRDRTNFREGGQQLVDAPSRGALVADFLASENDPETFLDALTRRQADFNGFNLFVGDGQRLGYYSNRGQGPRWLAPGIYGPVSYTHLDVYKRRSVNRCAA